MAKKVAFLPSWKAVNFSLDAEIWQRFRSVARERGQKNLSGLVSRLMQCYCQGSCVDCPDFDAGDEHKNICKAGFLGVPVSEFSWKQRLEANKRLPSDFVKNILLLTYREQRVLELRYSSEGGRTLKEVGKEFNVSRERIRQIETKALSKLDGTFHMNYKCEICGQLFEYADSLIYHKREFHNEPKRKHWNKIKDDEKIRDHLHAE